MAAIDQPVFGGLSFDLPFGVGQHFKRLPISGQPSSPGICVSELRFGGVKVTVGEATLCIDMAIAPVSGDRDFVTAEGSRRTRVGIAHAGK